MEIIEVIEVSDGLVESMERLMPQLTQQPVPGKEELAEIIGCENSILVTACEGGGIVGMLMLVLYRTPSGLKGRIEDVVVDELSRGKGIGEAMVRYAIEIARQRKATCIDLTSNPKRKAAHKLYENIGFKKHETNVYRYPLS